MQQQAAAMAQQQGVFPPRMPAQFSNPLQLHGHQHQQQQQQQLHQQHQQAIPGQMHFRSTGPSNGMHPMQTEATLGSGKSGASPTTAGGTDPRAGSKQDGPEGGLGSEGQGNSAPGTGHSGGQGDPSQPKSSEEGK